MLSLKTRLWNYVEDTSFLTDEDCWNWIGTKHKRGYGQLSINGICVTAPRLAFFLFKDNSIGLITGKLPDILICHKCDNPSCINPSCINPSHLFAGSAKANTIDSVRKGRSRTGILNPNVTLNKEKVLDIRNLFDINPDVNKLKIAKVYGISKSCLQHVLRRETWKHI